MKWASPVVQRLYEAFAREAVPWIERRTVVIYGVTDIGNAVPDGSGALLQVADRCFVLTAGHVLADWGSRYYALSLGELGHVDLTSIPAEVSAEDKGDLALLPLTDEMVQRIKQSGKEFVRLYETDPLGDEPVAGVHAVLGYPKPLAKSDGNGGWVSDAIWYPTELAPSLNHDPGLEIVLEIHAENLDADGDRAPLPYLGGISGCGIWRLHTKGDRPEEWSVGKIRLVGIEHHVVGKEEGIKGTRIRHVLAGIADRYPELARPIELVGIRVVKRPR